MNTTLFSIVIPSYQGYTGIEEILERLSTQTVSADNFEVIIVVDSVERSERERYREVFNNSPVTNLKCIFNEQNIGSFASRKKGMLVAAAPYIIGIDDDVIIKNDFLAQYLNATRERPGKSVFCGDIQHLPPKTCFQRYLTTTETYFGYHGIGDLVECGYSRFYTSNFCIPRNVLSEISFAHPVHDSQKGSAYGYDELLLGLELESLGYKFYYAKKASVIHNEEVQIYPFLQKKYRAGMTVPMIVTHKPELAKLLHYSPYIRWFPIRTLPGERVTGILASFLDKIARFTRAVSVFKIPVALAFFAGMAKGFQKMTGDLEKSAESPSPSYQSTKKE